MLTEKVDAWKDAPSDMDHRGVLTAAALSLAAPATLAAVWEVPEVWELGSRN